MSVLEFWNSIAYAGVDEKQSHTFSDKLQTRNRLSFFCAIFSFVYVFYFLIIGHYIPLLAISVGIFLFIASIFLNHIKKFSLSSSLLLINTNYCVLFFSIYLGFNSGIHLYLFTSPLIVLTLFDTKKTMFIALAMSSSVLNFAILIFTEKILKVNFLVLTKNESDMFYIINFICSTCILMTLSLYFLYNNNKVNHLLLLKNKQLIFQQEQLKEENVIRKVAEERAILSLSEREILLSEIHHRVKNNLAVVTGLIELQSFYVNDKKTLEILKESQSRIKSIALLHEKLYENKSLKEVDVLSYTNELIHFIKQSLRKKEKDIQIYTDIEKINLEMTKAMPFGLLLNELITNSYKYAFLNKEHGTIWLTLFEKNNEYVLQYKDDGPGFEYSSETKKTSLGLNLIEAFCLQLNGNFTYKNSNNFMIFEFKFPALKN